MSEDWYVASIDKVEHAANDVRAALDNVMDGLDNARRDRGAGVALVDIVRQLVVRGGRELRRGPTVAFAEFEKTLTAYRAAAIQALVDDEHLSFSEIGVLTGVSRQMVARLYRTAKETDDQSS
ncbi:MAG TPA: hypothetical protein VGC84_00300 [Ilumatobacteraceae bacterium]|jgi:hypothetical protein